MPLTIKDVLRAKELMEQNVADDPLCMTLSAREIDFLFGEGTSKVVKVGEKTDIKGWVVYRTR